jgi:hypothetical protein
MILPMASVLRLPYIRMPKKRFRDTFSELGVLTDDYRRNEMSNVWRAVPNKGSR